jgi:hypothetical protein
MRENGEIARDDILWYILRKYIPPPVIAIKAHRDPLLKYFIHNHQKRNMI